MKISKPISLCGILILLSIPYQQVNAQQPQYGEVDFGVSCHETVRAGFDRALAMLHNMMYVTAREDFEEITETDPNCAMAYWGIATTLFQPLWGTRPGKEDLRRGWHTIEKARDLVDSAREEYLVESSAAFFREPETADFWMRIRRWAEAMEDVCQAYPEDQDIAA